MKIFNWVHRRFNNKDGLAENARKNSLVADERTNSAFSNVFDDWKGGILTIGTFGYDPLKDDHVFFYDEYQSEKEQLEVENESDSEQEEEEADDDEEVNPLIHAAYTHDHELLMEMKMDNQKRGSGKDDFGFDSSVINMNTKKERTTLAELFSADSEELQKREIIIKKGGKSIKEKSKNNDNNNNNNNKNGLSFAKKLIGEDARPIHKLNRLMRRMLKRKIHPDNIVLNKHNSINYSKKKNENVESASLLPTQDINNII